MACKHVHLMGGFTQGTPVMQALFQKVHSLSACLQLLGVLRLAPCWTDITSPLQVPKEKEPQLTGVELWHAQCFPGSTLYYTNRCHKGHRRVEAKKRQEKQQRRSVLSFRWKESHNEKGESE
eukprot:437855-Pelagomonas_calceolata.AAC.1